jgi:glycerophosphoryl diester phosphodiesterase
MLLLIHRGDRSYYPENSLEALSKALSYEDGIETDVQITTDGLFYLFHDDTLDKLTYSTGSTHNLSSYDIFNLTLRSKINKVIRIPTLSQLLTMNQIYNKILNLEIKIDPKKYNPETIIKKLNHEISKYAQHNYVFISSFYLDYYKHCQTYGLRFALLIEDLNKYKIEDMPNTIILDKDLPTDMFDNKNIMLGVYTLDYNDIPSDKYKIVIVDKFI